MIDSLVYDGRNDLTMATDPSTDLNDLEGGSLYTYLVGVLSEAGESDRSASLDVSTAAPAPTALTSVSQTTTGMELSWMAPEVSSGDAVTDTRCTGTMVLAQVLWTLWRMTAVRTMVTSCRRRAV